jgi:hypothetical protein
MLAMLCVLVFSVALLRGSLTLGQNGNYPIATLPPGTPQLSIMFVGNSYTLTNNLPRLLSAIAADAQSPIAITTATAASPGALLLETWNKQDAQATLDSQHWDYVVLQEQSLMTMTNNDQTLAQAGFQRWGQSIHNVQAMPVVFETWARQPGSAAYAGSDATTMQAQIDYVLGSDASAIGAIIVPAGDAWMRCAAQPGTPLLYAPDGAHPSLAGTYLTAMLFYRILTGHPPANSNFVPDGLTPTDAQTLRACAS